LFFPEVFDDFVPALLHRASERYRHRQELQEEDSLEKE
jgi:hypothetical protein